MNEQTKTENEDAVATPSFVLEGGMQWGSERNLGIEALFTGPLHAGRYRKHTATSKTSRQKGTIQTNTQTVRAHNVRQHDGVVRGFASPTCLDRGQILHDGAATFI